MVIFDRGFNLISLDKWYFYVQVKGNEEALARTAMVAAHNTATLSAYVTEVCNTSTDMALSDSKCFI